MDEVSENDKKCKRPLYVVEGVKAGEIITEKNVRSIRPGFGMHPMYLKEVLNDAVSENLRKGTPLQDKFLTQNRKKNT